MHGVVDQVSSDGMGKTFVGLFDENMKAVFWIYMGDSWGGSTQGYFNTIYYAENGDSSMQQSGNIYTDFDKVGSLWYDRGINSIRSTITGMDATTLAAVDNPERVIMYLVVTVQAYDSYSLLDMRIHDINIEVNVRTAPPNMEEPPPGEDPLPTQKDGSYSGIASLSAEQRFDDASNEANNHITNTWILIVFWPALEVLGSYLVNGVVNLVHFTVDLLSNVNILSAQAGLADEDKITQEEVSVLTHFFVGLVVYSTIKGGLALICAAENWGLQLANPSAIAAFLVGLGLVIFGVLLAINHVETMTASGEMSHLTAGLFYFALAMSMLSIILFNSVKGILSFMLVFYMTVIWEFSDPLKATWSFLGMLIRWTKVIVIFLTVLFFVLSAIQLELWRQG